MPIYENVAQTGGAEEAMKPVHERYVVDINNGYHRIESDDKLFAVNLFKALFASHRFSLVRFYERIDVVETIMTHEMKERYIYDI